MSPRSMDSTPHTSDREFIADSDEEEHASVNLHFNQEHKNDDTPAALLKDMDAETLLIYQKSLHTNQRPKRKRRKPSNYYQNIHTEIVKLYCEDEDPDNGDVLQIEEDDDDSIENQNVFSQNSDSTYEDKEEDSNNSSSSSDDTSHELKKTKKNRKS